VSRPAEPLIGQPQTSSREIAGCDEQVRLPDPCSRALEGVQTSDSVDTRRLVIRRSMMGLRCPISAPQPAPRLWAPVYCIPGNHASPRCTPTSKAGRLTSHALWSGAVADLLLDSQVPGQAMGTSATENSRP